MVEAGTTPTADDLIKPQGIRRKRCPVSRVTAEEKERERLLATTGDECRGRGELGRRLEALLSVDDEDKEVIVLRRARSTGRNMKPKPK